MIFLQPERLFFLLPAAFLIFLIAWKRKKPYYTHPLLSHIIGRISPVSHLVHAPKVLELLALVVLLPALLDPVLPLARYTVAGEGLDIVLVVDLSSSMEEPVDLEGALKRQRRGIVQKEKTRIEAVKEAMAKFVQNRHGDHVGVVVFSEEGYVVVPMTTDIPYVVRYLNMVETATLAGEGQTAIGEGIWAALDLVQNQASMRLSERKGKVIVVLTDGENNSGRDVVEALESAGKAGFRVHFIGMEVDKTKEAHRLIPAVHATGGKYFDVRKEPELMQAYFDINRMEKTRFISTTEVKNVPHYEPFALVSFFLLLASLLLRTYHYFDEIS